MNIDLTEMPSGDTYENTYGKYMDIFERIATTSEPVVVINPPNTWKPLLAYLNCDIRGGQVFFEHDDYINDSMLDNIDRTAVEVLTGFRPETVDALWKIDMQWDMPAGRLMAQSPKKDFIITNNGSFHRFEVLGYMHRLENYTPTKKKVVLCPCAANKPYPAELHQRLLNMLPDDYYLMIATGVLGLVPQDLWDVMPWYDSGIPNEWRLKNTVSRYFTKHEHERVVLYTDYYTLAILEGLEQATSPGLSNVASINEAKFYYDYLDLLDETRLAKLSEELT